MTILDLTIISLGIANVSFTFIIINKANKEEVLNMTVFTSQYVFRTENLVHNLGK